MRALLGYTSGGVASLTTGYTLGCLRHRLLAFPPATMLGLLTTEGTHPKSESPEAVKTAHGPQIARKRPHGRVSTPVFKFTGNGMKTGNNTLWKRRLRSHRRPVSTPYPGRGAVDASTRNHQNRTPTSSNLRLNLDCRRGASSASTAEKPSRTSNGWSSPMSWMAPADGPFT